MPSVAEDMGEGVEGGGGGHAGISRVELSVELLEQHADDQVLAEATDLTLR